MEKNAIEGQRGRSDLTHPERKRRSMKKVSQEESKRV